MRKIHSRQVIMDSIRILPTWYMYCWSVLIIYVTHVQCYRVAYTCFSACTWEPHGTDLHVFNLKLKNTMWHWNWKILYDSISILSVQNGSGSSQWHRNITNCEKEWNIWYSHLYSQVFFYIVNNKPEVIIQYETRLSIIYPRMVSSGKNSLCMNCFPIYFWLRSIPHFFR